MEYIYLDNASTTKIDSEVLQFMIDKQTKFYANPSSSHILGAQSFSAIKSSANQIIECIGDPGIWEVVFTASGTEANNLAISGYSSGPSGRRIVITSIEHSSILEPCKLLTEKKIEVIKVNPETNGIVKPENLMKQINSSTFLVSIQHANNEIGTIQPVELIGQEIKRLFPEVLLHVDAVQSAGKIDLKGIGQVADLITLSAHKFQGPKGVGALLIRKGIKKPAPIIRGGGQQGGMRSGTENTPAIMAMAFSLIKKTKNLHESAKYLFELEKVFDSNFENTSLARRIFSDSSHIPGFIVVGFDGLPSEVLEHAMEKEGIIISSGAACSSRKNKRSHVLEAVKLSRKTNVVRIVASTETKPDEMVITARKLKQIIEKISSSQ